MVHNIIKENKMHFCKTRSDLQKVIYLMVTSTTCYFLKVATIECKRKLRMTDSRNVSWAEVNVELQTISEDASDIQNYFSNKNIIFILNILRIFKYWDDL